jgi:hypothetical protein
MISVLQEIVGIEPVKLTGPLSPRPDVAVVLDGTMYELTSVGFYPSARAEGGARLNGNVDSPVGRWAEKMFNALGGCWQDQPPDRP